ncbi:triphosphoribosyl-dephospho-CoA synthase [Solibacillus sp. MA9]|uniref:triphosphoribosyl-dephospho-CoA synthase n=1 Tax=Solibacillus palustris TaxID=2908203 RepID=A0ABS9U7J9_9BACL|nr:triphosphoribosyl-dephospho-CoA synthase [Solibacillus sp. MA9]MCH7320321.1 triphosphoribosyl-dephospho-CoA synthase [Solibacillus sp. MA9]
MKQHLICKRIADEAVAALIEEVQLTPKPGLVDTENNGAHNDLSISKMQNSAHSLHNTFYQMAMLSFNRQPTVEIREQFGAIGRNGEKEMFAVTENSNTHKGAIWSIGLLCSAIARRQGEVLFPQVFTDAAELANLPDQYIPKSKTNGSKVKENYGIPGAREEAQQAFPHIQKYSLPTFLQAAQIMSLREAKLSALLVLIVNLNDTCLLHRGGLDGLMFAKREAKKLLSNFSISNLKKLDDMYIKRWLSPGGSADLLAATLFVINISGIMKRGVQHGKVELHVSSKSFDY